MTKPNQKPLSGLPTKNKTEFWRRVNLALPMIRDGAPSIRDLGIALGMSSKGSVWWFLEKLLLLGFVERSGANCARALRLTYDGARAVAHIRPGIVVDVDGVQVTRVVDNVRL